MPSVGGREKLQVGAVLVGAASATGALAGFAAGLLGLVVGAATPAAALGVLAAAAAGDLLAGRQRGRPAPRPWSVGRQVPREWARLFRPPAVALLYGARLGVGPLTILPTWLWWAVTLLAATHGPAPSALVGAVFGGVRAGAMLGVAEWAHHAMAARIARIRAAEPAVCRAVAACALGCGAAAMLVP